jgi:CMP-2-keto-3-deoxyoctulosonic acid synthetase
MKAWRDLLIMTGRSNTEHAKLVKRHTSRRHLGR